MRAQASKHREFTGGHLLALMIAFFGVIIAVNLTLATFARSSWTGTVVANSYVASQHFNERAAEGRAQAALGWSGSLEIGSGGISYRLVDKSGSPIPLRAVKVSLRRPAYAAEDQTIELASAGEGTFTWENVIRDGIWIAEVHADAGMAAPYREVRRIVVRSGVAQ
jgi:nitrogen fixation protein FixH